MRQPLVILEGPDGAGKSTVYQAFRRATDYQILIIDRWTGSQMVYDTIGGRTDKTQIWTEEELKLREVYQVFLFVCQAPDEVLRARIIAKNDRLDNYIAANKAFAEYLRSSKYLFKLGLDTTKSVEECVRTMLRFISWYRE